jgi:DNA-directed RNA polymerase specialized sigma24 family protein
MVKWTEEQVAERFHEAAETSRRLPGLKSQGYFSVWPGIQRERWEGYAGEDRVMTFPPTPDAVARLEETQKWLLWLDEPQRHLVWMRAEGWRWPEIAKRIGCDRTTAWRRWRSALGLVTVQLNPL